MLKIFFADVFDGRLRRLPFLGYSLLLLLLFGLVMMGIGASIGVAEQLVGGELQQAQALLRERFGVLAILLVMLLAAMVLFASANMMAKRFRDMGLPGWTVVLACVVIGAVLSHYVSIEAASGFNGLSWLLLLLVPGRAPAVEE